MVVFLRDEVLHELIEMIGRLNGTVLTLMERIELLQDRLNMLERERSAVFVLEFPPEDDPSRWH